MFSASLSRRHRLCNPVLGRYLPHHIAFSSVGTRQTTPVGRWCACRPSRLAANQPFCTFKDTCGGQTSLSSDRTLDDRDDWRSTARYQAEHWRWPVIPRPQVERSRTGATGDQGHVKRAVPRYTRHNPHPANAAAWRLHRENREDQNKGMP